MGKLNSGKKGGFRYALIRGCLLGEAGSRLTRQNILCDWFGKHVYLPLFGQILEEGTKNGKAQSPLPSPDYSGPNDAEIGFGSMSWLLKTSWVRVLVKSDLAVVI